MYLDAKTYYSFCFGTYSTQGLVDAALEQGVSTLALCNINCTYDHWEFVKLCREAGIKPVLGVDVRNGDTPCYLLIAKNNEGLCWINGFLSLHLIEKKDFPDSPFASDDVFVIYPYGSKEAQTLKSNERIGIKPYEVSSILNFLPGYHYVIHQPVVVQDSEHYYLHYLLRAIDKNLLFSAMQPEYCCHRQDVLLPPAKLLQAFRHYPTLVTNTYKLLDACSIEMDFDSDKTMQVYGGSKEDDFVLLDKLARAGLVRRYGKKNKTATDRLEKELKVIYDLGFTAYFLINHDFVRFANEQGYYHVGRGSGANSIVAYCLGITDVDPIELNLYFERFLNPERTSPPDFDIDFSWTDRDEVMAYMFTRYGKKHVALLGSCPTFKHDSIIRELGKVYGLPDEEIKTFQRDGVATCDKTQRIKRFGELMRGFPSTPSIHPCGVLISEKPILQYGTLFHTPKSERTGMAVIQMDMFTAEDIGLNKFDVLSQRGLGHIKDCQALIKQNHGKYIDIHNTKVFFSDERIKKQIREANTIGCFYIESPAMRGLLKKLGCDDYITLVAASSIIRPGVAQSGMMRAFIERYHNPASVEYIHPLFEEHLGETYGVMVYQEDVIKIAHYYGGLSLGKADILRRAMSGKYRSSNRFNLIREEFFASAIALGRDPEQVAEVWRQMVSFAGYSFNKAHSASFAVESYMSLYLKTYYPQEFMVAVINNFGGFYSRELYFMELLKCGGDIHLPCVNNSDHLTNIVEGKVYVGFIHIKGVQDKLIEKITDERKANGLYKSLDDFIERTRCGLEQLNTLIRIGTLRFTGKTKKALLWEANFLQKKMQAVVPGVQAMFNEPLKLDFALPLLIDDPIDDLYDQMEIMGFCTSNPFSLADADPATFVPARDMEKHKGKNIVMFAYFIARKHVITKNDDAMFFGTFVDSELNWIDTVHFPDAAKRHPLHNSGFYKIKGRVTEDFGVYSLEVQYMEKIGYRNRSYAN
ncbi:MAG: DNA polymerase III subunit alpha [Pseudanabaena sp. M57BS1SP1A06MG]|nr:DNA polymerase III subunit alpha [Chitinophagaceae bacterium]MCA6460378.1 DNA polymerase III subunit alpha [Chitinophagaceae bacterium]MCA6465265.1 DNA polymerase III subunit alpha [Chitinophagaceae bacterium]MCA6601151.1 DNA polymerase III subunit alpha [Pseudanabaena sp. M57BS1SP1A06MG]